MNYANMIEEKKLKKGFIIATLVSTVIGTLATSMNFYERVQEKKNNKKQAALDKTQDQQIQDLKAEMKKLQSRDDRRERSRSRSSSASRSKRRRRKSVGNADDEDFRRSALKSRAMIEREYNENVMRMGDRYAQGDAVTENKLQAQIITLQQAVINVLQEALVDGRTLSKADIHRLIAAQDMAREGSLDALRGQYKRLLPDPYASKQLQIEAPRSTARVQRQLTLPVEHEEVFAPPRRAQSMPEPASYDELHCSYSIKLQTSKASIASAFTAGICRCPDCGFRMPVTKQDVWSFEVRKTVRDDLIERRMYEMDARMVLKSHTPFGDYACVLCTRERDKDCICKNVDDLVDHIGREHSSEEFEREWDMHRV